MVSGLLILSGLTTVWQGELSLYHSLSLFLKILYKCHSFPLMLCNVFYISEPIDLGWFSKFLCWCYCQSLLPSGHFLGFLQVFWVELGMGFLLHFLQHLRPGARISLKNSSTALLYVSSVPLLFILSLLAACLVTMFSQ